MEKIIEAMSKDQDYKGDKVDSKEEKDTKEDKVEVYSYLRIIYMY